MSLIEYTFFVGISWQIQESKKSTEIASEGRNEDEYQGKRSFQR